LFILESEKHMMRPKFRYRLRATVAAATMTVAAGCATQELDDPAPREEEAATATANDLLGAPRAADTYAPHFEPASARLSALPPLPSRLPSSAEDTGRYNQRKPKEVITTPAALPQDPVDPQLSRRQQDYLARWREQEAGMRGASPEAVDKAREELKQKVVGE
jgi:hypothetical protein